MKTKTIAKILAGKHAAWCRSITDEATRKLAEEQTIITGGAIVNLLTDQPVNDFDCYFRTPEAAFAIARYYVAKLKENPPPAFKGDATHTVDIKTLLEDAIPEGQERMRIGGVAKGPLPARVRIVVQSAGIAGETEQKDYQYFEGAPAAEQPHLTDAYVSAAMGERAEGEITDPTEPDTHPGGYEGAAEDLDDIPAATLDEPAPKTKAEKQEAAKRGKYRVLFVTSNAITLSDGMQLVIRFQGEVTDIHRNFDFQHCLGAWTSYDKELTTNVDTLLCIMNKELKYVGSLYPIASLIRTRKFIKRGYTINAGQYVKMAWQVAQLDLSNPNVLEDQLVGVDSAYFTQVITALKEKMAKEATDGGPSPQVDGAYLLTLVDKVFG